LMLTTTKEFFSKECFLAISYSFNLESNPFMMIHHTEIVDNMRR
jgi:hypothetical protein